MPTSSLILSTSLSLFAFHSILWDLNCFGLFLKETHFCIHFSSPMYREDIDSLLYDHVERWTSHSLMKWNTKPCVLRGSANVWTQPNTMVLTFRETFNHHLNWQSWSKKERQHALQFCLFSSDSVGGKQSSGWHLRTSDPQQCDLLREEVLFRAVFKSACLLSSSPQKSVKGTCVIQKQLAIINPWWLQVLKL